MRSKLRNLFNHFFVMMDNLSHIRLTTIHHSIPNNSSTSSTMLKQPEISRPAITIPTFVTKSNEVVSDEVNSNCFEHLIDGHGSGIYHISPNGMDVFDVFCDQETDGGGWTVIQKYRYIGIPFFLCYFRLKFFRRIDGQVYFYNRTWSEYEQGFGSLSSSHWLGLKNIYKLAPRNSAWWTLRIELRGDHCNKPTKCSGEPNGYWWAEWDFRLGDAASKYMLDLSPARRGNLTDTLAPDNFFKLNGGRPFTTIDRDNDRNTDFNCAQFRNYGFIVFHSGWWHHDCGYVALNGLYGDTEPKMRYMVYFYHQPVIRGKIGLSYHIHPKQSVMMIKPKF
uniref:Fibrinogen C-terminal domain-containing protein n=1 Tax=Heterorhabditis bacteriophora TaxID=37862 RepID=A0A1I7XFE7_HETBA